METPENTLVFTKKDRECAQFLDANFQSLSDNMQVMVAKTLVRKARKPKEIAKVLKNEAARL